METAATPMIRQYQAIKKKYEDCILFYRLGDFYEMFFEDAKEASRILDLVLTSRGKGAGAKVPMCGIPFHAAENYISKLIQSGKKVAICEQTEDPTQAKGIVKRDVVRVVTAGTYIDESTHKPRYCACLYLKKKTIGLAYCDPAHGEICVKETDCTESILQILAKLVPHELICPESQKNEIEQFLKIPLFASKNILLSPHEDWVFNEDISYKTLCDHFGTHSLRGFGCENMKLAISSAGALLEYMRTMNKQPMKHIDSLRTYSDENVAFISPAAIYGLELDSLLAVIDRTTCSLGKRMFRQWLFNPLVAVSDIHTRQEAVTLFMKNDTVRNDCLSLLNNFPDIEKHLSRISSGLTHARDLLAIRNALCRIPQIQVVLSPISEKSDLLQITDITVVRTLVENAVSPEIPLSNPEGKIINKGFNAQLDELREVQTHGKERLKKMQEREIVRTGINSLKIGYNKVFGYYLEVSKSNLKNVPEDYIRKQTLVNGERFITPELKEFEEKMLSAESKIAALETDLVKSLCHDILKYSFILHRVSNEISIVDCLLSLALLGTSDGYIRPHMTEDLIIDIKDGRHPVVESLALEPFIANDTYCNSDDHHFLIITGPNMSGKSTYIRQSAILVIMAQMGSYIPASAATIGIVDKFYTRIGAHDEISKGQSTFMVEMCETAGILNNLSARSLVILDEIGRGTSTYDGLSLAWAVAEYLESKKVRTLFATHFHELMALSEERPGVKNYNVDVKEWNDEIIFLHKIVPGGTDDSYGIYVAKLAGIPKTVINRSKKILAKLEMKSDIAHTVRSENNQSAQLSLFEESTLKPFRAEEKYVCDTIRSFEVDTMTPLEALTKLTELKAELDNE